VRQVLFSQNDQLVASGGEDGAVWLWDTGRGEPRQLADQLSQVRALALSPDGELLASGSSDGVLHLWKLRTGTSHSVYHMGVPVQDVAFSPDAHHVGAVGRGKIARVWPVESNEAALPVESEELRAWIQKSTTATIRLSSPLNTPDMYRLQDAAARKRP
jgi:WD40 repeat protein